MIINAESLIGVFTAYKRAFSEGLRLANPEFMKFTMEVPSSSRQNQYGWLKQMPGVREWVGERVYNNISTNQYVVPNRKWESTIEVERDDIEDDQFGEYARAFQMLGRKAALHPGKLVYETINAGDTLICYDGQPFFDTAHPMGNKTYSNITTGGGEPWYVLDATQPVKPLGLQMRREFDLQMFINPTDPVVWQHDKYQFGGSGRYAGLYGLPQLAYRHEGTLNDANLDVVLTAMRRFKDDQGDPLDVTPNILLVGAGNEYEGRKLVEAINNDAGATNVFRNRLELIVSNYLAAS